MSKATINFDNFAEWHGTVDGVELETYLPLPNYVPTSDIQVDLGRIARVGRAARLERVSFGLYDEDQDSNALVNGVNSDGSATATAVKTARARRSRASVQQWLVHRGDFQRGEARVRINVNHPDMDDKVLRDAEPWAKLLDKGVRDGLKNAGKQQLLNPSRLRIKEAMKKKTWDGVWSAGIALLEQDPSNFPLILGVWSVLDAVDPIGRALRKIHPGDNRFDVESSLMRGYPFDRYLATVALTSTTKLVTSK